MLKNLLFPDDVSDDDIAAYTRVTADFDGCPVEQINLATCGRDQILTWQNRLRKARGELIDGGVRGEDENITKRVCARALQAIGEELNERSALGSHAPRAHVGRQTSPGAADDPARPLAVADAPRQMTGRMSDIYLPRGNGGVNGFSSFGAFALAAVRDPTDPRLRAAVTTMQREDVGADGGFAVAPIWVDQLLDGALEQEAIRPRANVIPVSSGSAVFPAFDFSSQVGAKRAGVELKWMSEGGAGTDQSAQLRDVTLKMAKGGIFISLSSEIFEDMVNAERRIGNIMSAADAAGLDYAFVNGTGVGQPTGILNSPALISVTKEGSQTATTLNLQNLVKMVGRLHPRSYRNATWLIHPTVVPSLLQMTVTIANRANTENVGGSFAPAVTFAADGSMVIFGRPVVVTDACAPLGTVGDVILADLSRYLVAVRREATLQTSIHAGWSQDLFAMRLILRLNAQTEDNAVTTLRDGTNTVSPFVVVETRS